MLPVLWPIYVCSVCLYTPSSNIVSQFMYCFQLVLAAFCLRNFAALKREINGYLSRDSSRSLSIHNNRCPMIIFLVVVSVQFPFARWQNFTFFFHFCSTKQIIHSTAKQWKIYQVINQYTQDIFNVLINRLRFDRLNEKCWLCDSFVLYLPILRVFFWQLFLPFVIAGWMLSKAVNKVKVCTFFW